MSTYIATSNRTIITVALLASVSFSQVGAKLQHGEVRGARKE